ncbi:TRAF3-interacting protein 1-like isoform X3 [Strongylocentrotus purpuratus]|uniref:TRAF3-interacting protein 1 n=1 Tax=Strongylocentrotus purpuratus TaxID=7668 RepID=A0A7M7PT66_STRPU|nr:TRAF3-interacting protein 1-like isoform X3 [Strongylocentrotus purpuratus]
MGEEFIKKTQDSLGKIIKKPPMTEKLLKKPPFRFLHDVFTEIIRTTGFMKGLLSEAEMDSQNVKDKDAKIALLQKVVDVVAMVTGKALSVKPSKIVAGHEPDKTNELLQALAIALSKKMDSSESVKKVLNGEKGSSGKPPRPKKDDDKKNRDTSADKRNKENKDKEKKSSSDNRERSGSRDRLKTEDKKSRDRSKDRERSSKDREKSKDRERSKDREKDKSKDKEEKSRSKDKEREERKEKDKKEKEKEERDKERRERRKRKDEEAKQAQNEEEEQDLRPPAPEGEDVGGSNRIPRPSSAKGSRRRPTKDGDDSDGEGELDGRQESAKHRSRTSKENGEGGLTADDALPPQVAASRRMARPSSARPAPPRLKKQDSTEDTSRIGSGKQVSNVIVDNGHSDDEDDIFVVEDTQPSMEDEPRPQASDSMEDDGEHGGLVKKILETKKELEGSQNKEDDKPVVLDPARRKERELVQREVEKLRSAIQTLTRSANPLGKIMDYLQEDVDSMQKELEMWQRENKEHGLAIKREQGITDSELEPLQAQLAQLDQSIEDQVDTIAAVKANILRNEEKIGKMVNSIAFTR